MELRALPRRLGFSAARPDRRGGDLGRAYHPVPFQGTVPGLPAADRHRQRLRRGLGSSGEILLGGAGRKVSSRTRSAPGLTSWWPRSRVLRNCQDLDMNESGVLQRRADVRAQRLMDAECDAQEERGRGLGDLRVRPRRSAGPAPRRSPMPATCRHQRSTNTWGETAMASTPSRSSVSAAFAPGRRSNDRRPDASTSTSSPGESAGINGPLTRTPPDTARSTSLSERWAMSTIASVPAPDRQLRTLPSGRPAACPGGRRASRARAPRRRANRGAARRRRHPTRPTGSAQRRVIAPTNRTPPAAPIPSGSISDGAVDQTKPPPHPSAKPPQIHVAARPAREPARSVIRRAGRRGGSAPDRRPWPSQPRGRRGADSST